MSRNDPSIRNVELRLGHQLKSLKVSYRVLQEKHEGQVALVQEYKDKIASLEKDKAMFIELIDRYKADASGSPAGATTLMTNARRSAPPLQLGTSKRSKSAHAPIDRSDTPQVIDKPKNFFPTNTNRQLECLISGSSDNDPQYMPSTQLHTATFDAVISQMKVWERRNRSRNAWDWRRLSNSGACIHTAVVTRTSGHSQRWTEFDRACDKCTESKRPCMKVHQKANGEEAVLLPLPDVERGFTSKEDPGFWVRQ